MNTKQAHGLIGQTWDVKSGPNSVLEFFGESNNALGIHVGYWLSGHRDSGDLPDNFSCMLKFP